MYLPAGDDVASGARWHADVAPGTTARVRRGAEATWQSWGGPREARTRGRRPRVSTQVHADARVGRHVAMGGRHLEGPRNSGPW